MAAAAAEEEEEEGRERDMIDFIYTRAHVG